MLRRVEHGVGAAGLWALPLAWAFGCAGTASAAPVVSVNVTGSAGDWTLDFGVTNTLGIPTMKIYFIGVSLGTNHVIGSPGNFTGDPNGVTFVNLSGFGGSNTDYDNLWEAPTNLGIADGVTLNGFQVKSSLITLPSQISWFAFAHYNGQAVYTGNDHIWFPFNPGFEGQVATGAVTVVPEPGTLVAALIGMACLALAQARRRREIVGLRGGVSRPERSPAP
jgi:hypothetical protein